MSAYSVTTRFLTCDSPSCPREYQGGANLSNVKVRAAAKRDGWSYIPGHPSTGANRDFCPAHRLGVSRVQSGVGQ